MEHITLHNYCNLLGSKQVHVMWRFISLCSLGFSYIHFDADWHALYSACLFCPQVWIFDQPDGGGRLLRQRLGHSAPPDKIRFHDHSGQVIVSAGQDSTLQTFSTVHDRHNRSLGRASFNKKETKKTGLKLDQHMMPPITDFASGRLAYDSERQSLPYSPYFVQTQRSRFGSIIQLS